MGTSSEEIDRRAVLAFAAGAGLGLWLGSGGVEGPGRTALWVADRGAGRVVGLDAALLATRAWEIPWPVLVAPGPREEEAPRGASGTADGALGRDGNDARRTRLDDPIGAGAGRALDAARDVRGAAPESRSRGRRDEGRARRAGGSAPLEGSVRAEPAREAPGASGFASDGARRARDAREARARDARAGGSDARAGGGVPGPWVVSVPAGTPHDPVRRIARFDGRGERLAVVEHDDARAFRPGGGRAGTEQRASADSRGPRGPNGELWMIRGRPGSERVVALGVRGERTVASVDAVPAASRLAVAPDGSWIAAGPGGRLAAGVATVEGVARLGSEVLGVEHVDVGSGAAAAEEEDGSFWVLLEGELRLLGRGLEPLAAHALAERPGRLVASRGSRGASVWHVAAEGRSIRRYDRERAHEPVGSRVLRGACGGFDDGEGLVVILSGAVVRVDGRGEVVVSQGGFRELAAASPA